LAIFTAVIALFVSVAWVSVGSRASAASATPVVYVATGVGFADALGASAAAAVQGGPVLLVTKNSIPSETATELSRLSPDVIYVAGGTAVVSDTVFEALKAFAPSVIRVAGSNRYATAAEVSRSAFPVTLTGGGNTAALEAAVAALTARLDAFETSGKAADSDLLDGLDSTTFAVSSHAHDTDYLAISGKAADSDLLDGLDSTAFVEHGEIVMTESGTAWMVRSQVTAGPIEVGERLAHSTVFTGQGYVVIGITGPAAIGGTEYGLASFDLCLFGGNVTRVSAVAIDFFGPDADDAEIYIDVTVQDGSVERKTGCYTYAVNTPVGQGIGLQVTLDGTAELFSVKSIWTPSAAAG
jgi:hypothetical protein